MNVILVWAWMLWLAYAVVHERYYDLGMDALVSVCSRNWTLLWFGHGCHERHAKSCNMSSP